MRALAGAFLLLAAVALAAPMAEAQTPAVPGFTVTPVAGSTDKLAVSWNEVSGIPGISAYPWRALAAREQGLLSVDTGGAAGGGGSAAQ